MKSMVIQPKVFCAPGRRQGLGKEFQFARGSDRVRFYWLPGDTRARELGKDQGYNLDGSLKKYIRYRGQIIPPGFPCHFPPCLTPHPGLKSSPGRF